MIGRPGGPAEADLDLALVVREIVDADPERGLALFTLDRRAVYSNAAARRWLRDGSSRGRDPLLPTVVDRALEAFVARVTGPRQSLTTEIEYPAQAEHRARITFETAWPNGVGHVVLRVAPATPWTEPTIRRLQARFGFTAREAQVASCVARGLSNGEIAGRLGLVEKSVKNVLMSVYKKCAARNRVELALRIFDAPMSGLPGSGDR